jgi:hypothetical protein
LACGTIRFAYDGSASSVHIAGSFNDWPATVSAGGYALSPNGNNGWSATVSVAPGRHEYKLVVNETDWIADPLNPDTSLDGFGGSNSALNAECARGGDRLTPPSLPSTWLSSLQSPPSSKASNARSST